jgi:hypothetical protein
MAERKEAATLFINRSAMKIRNLCRQKQKRCDGEPAHLVNSFRLPRSNAPKPEISVAANRAAPAAAPIATRPVDRRRDINGTAVKAIAPAISTPAATVETTSAPSVRRSGAEGYYTNQGHHDQGNCCQAAHKYAAVRNTGFFCHIKASQIRFRIFESPASENTGRAQMFHAQEYGH